MVLGLSGFVGLVVFKPIIPFSKLRINPINEGIARGIHLASRHLGLHTFVVQISDHFSLMLKLFDSQHDFFVEISPLTRSGPGAQTAFPYSALSAEVTSIWKLLSYFIN